MVKRPHEVKSVRNDAARFAIANTVLEGGCVSVKTAELIQQWVDGEIGDEKLIKATLSAINPT